MRAYSCSWTRSAGRRVRRVSTLAAREPWELSSPTDGQCHLMAQVMESWFLADPAALERFYGQGLRARQIPKRQNVEEVPKAEVMTVLETPTATRRRASTTRTSTGRCILESLDPQRVRARAPHCDRLFERWWRRSRDLAISSLVLAACAVLACAPVARAQLRPLEPFEWRMFDAGRSVSAQVGAGWLPGPAGVAGGDGGDAGGGGKLPRVLADGARGAGGRRHRAALLRRGVALRAGGAGCARRMRTASAATPATTACSPPCG